nr:MAG TPA: hypothetical protein [Caudoviricetes sp.]
MYRCFFLAWALTHAFFSASIRTHSPPFHVFSMFFRKVCVNMWVKVYIFWGRV